MLKSGCFLTLIFLLVACGSSEQVLNCEKEMRLEAFPGMKGDVRTTVHFRDEAVTKYVNKYILEVDQEDPAEVYEQIKEFYSKEENKKVGAQQNFDYSANRVIYEVVYDMADYDAAILDYFGNKDEVQYNLEQKDNYRCR